MKKQLLISMVCASACMLFTAKASFAQYVTPIRTLAVPATKGAIVIDGKPDADSSYSGWQDCMIAKEAGKGVTPHPGDQSDYNMRFRLCWDKTYLYEISDIIDDIENDYLIGKSNPWDWDNVETFIDLDTNSTTKVYSQTSTTQMRFCRGLLAKDGSDSLVESNGQGNNLSKADAAKMVALYKFKVDNENTLEGAVGWHFEVAIPWSAATDCTTVNIDSLTVAGGGTVLGFDIGAADSDGDNTATTGDGHRNETGGAQAFWDLDDPQGTGAEDDAYENRKLFGFISLEGTPADIHTTTVGSNVSVYPNPATDYVTFSKLEGISSAKIINLLGETVKSIQVANNKVTVNISDLSSGVYFFKADNSDQMTKFVVK